MSDDGLLQNPFFVFFLIAVVSLLIVSLPKIVEQTTEYETISTSYTVTDKWIRKATSTHYYLELNHTEVLETQRYTWQQYQIGDTYTIEKRVRQ